MLGQGDNVYGAEGGVREEFVLVCRRCVCVHFCFSPKCSLHGAMTKTQRVRGEAATGDYYIFKVNIKSKFLIEFTLIERW